MDKPVCKFCEKPASYNKKTEKHFPTCFGCRFKCPNFTECGFYRAKIDPKDPKSKRFQTCPKCRPEKATLRPAQSAPRPEMPPVSAIETVD